MIRDVARFSRKENDDGLCHANEAIETLGVCTSFA
jgi:hypothetical protein